MLRFRQAREINNINTKITLIDQAAMYIWYKSLLFKDNLLFLFSELSSHPWWYLQIGEYQCLLKKQRELQRVNKYYFY